MTEGQARNAQDVAADEGAIGGTTAASTRPADLASNAPPDPPAPPAPIRFEVRGARGRMSCTVSDEALELASSLSAPSTEAMRRRSFDRFRMVIDAAAKLKLADMPAEFRGPLSLSAEDLRRVPAARDMPQFGTASWAMRQSA